MKIYSLVQRSFHNQVGYNLQVNNTFSKGNLSLFFNRQGRINGPKRNRDYN